MEDLGFPPNLLLYSMFFFRKSVLYFIWYHQKVFLLGEKIFAIIHLLECCSLTPIQNTKLQLESMYIPEGNSVLKLFAILNPDTLTSIINH